MTVSLKIKAVLFEINIFQKAATVRHNLTWKANVLYFWFASHFFHASLLLTG